MISVRTFDSRAFHSPLCSFILYLSDYQWNHRGCGYILPHLFCKFQLMSALFVVLFFVVPIRSVFCGAPRDIGIKLLFDGFSLSSDSTFNWLVSSCTVLWSNGLLLRVLRECFVAPLEPLIRRHGASSLELTSTLSKLSCDKIRSQISKVMSLRHSTP